MENACQSLQPEKMSLKSIKYEGHLYKRGRGKKLSFVKPWRIRRFVLDTTTGDFTYFKDIDGKPSKKGYMNVSHASATKSNKEESGKDYSFKVTVNDEDIYLACSNDQDIDMWIDAINYCAKKVMLSPRRRSSSKPDRAFFLHSPRIEGIKEIEDLNEDEDNEDVVVDCDDDDDEDEKVCAKPGGEGITDNNLEHQGHEKITLSPSSAVHDTDVDTEEKEETLSRNLSIKMISSDGTSTALPVPNFNELVRGPSALSSSPDSKVFFNSNDCVSMGNKLDFEDDDEEFQEGNAEDEFPPLEDRFQKILVNASDFIIDKEHGICGTGAFGVVYKATRKSDNKIFALKFFGYAKRDPQNLDILGTEVDVMLKLKGSEVFAQIESFFYDSYEGLIPGKKFIDAYPVIVMEYLEQDLLSFLAMSTSTVIASTLPRAFKELVEGLACLHEKGFLHRDLKVDNVMISGEKKVKLIDFGFLCALPEGETEFLGPQTGTIGYFAPESIPLSGYSVFSAKSDIWQAGVILYTLVSGKMPFNISSFNIRKAKHPPLICPSWETRPEAVKDLIAHILVLKPQDRFTTSEILAHEWLAYQEPVKETVESSDNSIGDYMASINNLIQRRNIKKILQTIQDDAEGIFDRSFKAETIMDSIHITGGATYFMIRLGSLKSIILQNLTQCFNLYDSLNFTEFSQLMAKNALLELTSVEVFLRFCHEHGYYNAPKGEESVTSSTETITIKELLLTLVSLVQLPDQDDDALACFLKFDTKCTGYLEKESMLLIFRGLLEDEAMSVANGKSVENPNSSKNVDSELDDIENELKEIENVFACVKVKEGHPGITFSEFKQFHDSVMKISTRVSNRLSMRSMSMVSMAVGKFTDSLHSIRFKKQAGMANTARGASRNAKKGSKKSAVEDMSQTL